MKADTASVYGILIFFPDKIYNLCVPFSIIVMFVHCLVLFLRKLVSGVGIPSPRWVETDMALVTVLVFSWSTLVTILVVSGGFKLIHSYIKYDLVREYMKII